MSNFDFDVVIVGAGPGGYVSAIKCAKLGLKVACVDKKQENIGGTCLNVGCIPSKTMLEISHKFAEANHLFGDIGIKTGKVSIDIEAVLEKKSKVISGLRSGILSLFKKNKVEYLIGEAVFLDKNTIEIRSSGEVKKVTAKNFIIATGSSPVSLPGITIDEKTIISSTGALALNQTPKSIIVIGAGVIGLEMGSVWNRFGSEVTFVEYADRIIPTMDKEISTSALKIFASESMKFKLSTKVINVEVKKNGFAKVDVESVLDGKKESLEADIVLVAVGRKPNSNGLGLEKIGVNIDKRGFIENNHLRTSVENIFAIGDVTTGPMLAHKAEEDGIAAAEIIAGQHGHVDYNLVPNVVYTHPEISSIGQTEEELKSREVDYRVGKFPLLANSRARATFEDKGFVKILSCAKTDRILGAHIISREAGGLIHEIAVAMDFGGSSEDIARICHAHPTYNEAVKEAAMAVNKDQIHI